MAKGEVESHGTSMIERPGVAPICPNRFNSPVETHGTLSFDGTPCSRDGDNGIANRMVSPVETHGTTVDIPMQPQLNTRVRPEAKPPFND